ncbi:MAG TPA: c-type cytochrome [Tepidisphaeraceae bacterium]|jgi:mono/diheme cytochrome c family protein|nr:c-type cytochrome [Tepidisphaeraceae bacterium]
MLNLSWKRAAMISLPTLLVLIAAKEHTKAPQPPKANIAAADPIQAGKYLVMIAGCNDCHTPGYDQSHGKIPESDWLTGESLGFKGPWGTSYPSNLRLTVTLINEDGWVQMLRTRNARPPMPWLAVNSMSDPDLRALYQYIKSLGPKGEKSPDYLPPGADPKTPVVTFPTPPEE